MIDTHARIISDDMNGSAFEYGLDCPKSLRISTRCDVPLPILGHILHFIDEMFWLH